MTLDDVDNDGLVAETITVVSTAWFNGRQTFS